MSTPSKHGSEGRCSLRSTELFFAKSPLYASDSSSDDSIMEVWTAPVKQKSQMPPSKPIEAAQQKEQAASAKAEPASSVVGSGTKGTSSTTPSPPKKPLESSQHVVATTKSSPVATTVSTTPASPQIPNNHQRACRIPPTGPATPPPSYYSRFYQHLPPSSPSSGNINMYPPQPHHYPPQYPPKMPHVAGSGSGTGGPPVQHPPPPYSYHWDYHCQQHLPPPPFQQYSYGVRPPFDYNKSPEHPPPPPPRSQSHYSSYRIPQQFESRTSSTPLRFPEQKNQLKASRIPDDSEDSHNEGSAAFSQQGYKNNNNYNHHNNSSNNNHSNNNTNAVSSFAGRPPTSSLGTAAIPAPSSRQQQSQKLSAGRPKRFTAGKRKAFGDAANHVRKRKLVEYVAEWKPETQSWEETVFEYSNSGIAVSKRNMSDTTPPLFEHPGISMVGKRRGGNASTTTTTTTTSRRQRQRNNRYSSTTDNNANTTTNDNKNEKKEILVSGVEFDTRYLQYDKTPRGWLDQLVRPSLVARTNETPREEFLQSIPDEVTLPSTSSRVGCAYQARIGKFDEFRDKFGDDYLPGHDVLWDPKRADEAEKRGEDIEGFLSGNYELVKKQCLMELLHHFDYSVETARREYNRIVAFSGEPTSSMDPDEGRKFERLLKSKKKDFTTLARKMKRSPADCMIYYYRWKRTKNAYSSMKSEWKGDYCAVCDDGGDMIVCDKCERPYHLGCVDPPLKRIPAGAWFCPRCKPVASPVVVNTTGNRFCTNGTTTTVDYVARQNYSSPFSHSVAASRAPPRSTTGGVVYTW